MFGIGSLGNVECGTELLSMIGVVCSSPPANLLNSLVTWCVSEMAVPQNDVFEDGL